MVALLGFKNAVMAKFMISSSCFPVKLQLKLITSLDFEGTSLALCVSLACWCLHAPCLDPRAQR